MHDLNQGFILLLYVSKIQVVSQDVEQAVLVKTTAQKQIFNYSAALSLKELKTTDSNLNLSWIYSPLGMIFGSQIKHTLAYRKLHL